MAFKRGATLIEGMDDAALTRDMAGIGMNFAAGPNRSAPIEETLVRASAVGMDDLDLRVLSVLTTWLRVHHGYVNADRLVRTVSCEPSARVNAYWAAIARWLSKDRRFARLLPQEGASAVDLLPVGTAFQISRHGEDTRFAATALRVPAGTLRDRASDVLSPEALVRANAAYRNRVLMGPTWRADVWTVLEADPDITIADVARRAGCSFATAWQVVQDFALMRRARQEAGT